MHTIGPLADRLLKAVVPQLSAEAFGCCEEFMFTENCMCVNGKLFQKCCQSNCCRTTCSGCAYMGQSC